MRTLTQIRETAEQILTDSGHNGSYARDVLAGDRRWSGAGLKGKAAAYGSWSAGQRSFAAMALIKSGGCIVPIEHGHLVSAAPLGQDDYGTAIYATDHGIYAATGRKNLRQL